MRQYSIFKRCICKLYLICEVLYTPTTEVKIKRNMHTANEQCLLGKRCVFVFQYSSKLNLTQKLMTNFVYLLYRVHLCLPFVFSFSP